MPYARGACDGSVAYTCDGGVGSPLLNFSGAFGAVDEPDASVAQPVLAGLLALGHRAFHLLGAVEAKAMADAKAAAAPEASA